MYLLHVESVA